MLDAKSLTAMDWFHHHLDRCAQCRNHPFNLCAEGTRLIDQLGVEINLACHYSRPAVTPQTAVTPQPKGQVL